MIEMTVDSIRVSFFGNQNVLILKAKEMNKYLAIWISQAEGDFITVAVRDPNLPRPMTHDLTTSIIRGLGATITRVVVSELREDTFISHVVLESNGSTFEADSRPSDAIALALRSGAPIFAAEEVVDRVGIDLYPDSGEPTTPSGA